jgi:uncharacterized membrane protein YheB (UPF0754 family)
LGGFRLRRGLRFTGKSRERLQGRMRMKFFLDWILPILVGGAIGYITNDIAIKMLFRPLKQLRLFGVKVPFTPGILPKNRHRLASSIGDTVSKELITEEVLKKRIEDPEFRRSVELVVESFTSSFLSTKLEAFRFPKEGSPENPVMPLITGLLDALMRSESFTLSLGDAARALIESSFAIKLEDLVSPEDAERIARKILDLAASEESRARLVDLLSSILARLEDSGKTISDFLPEGLPELASKAALALFPRALDSILGYMRRPEVRKELEYRGAFLVRGIIGRFSVFQRLIIAATQYDRNIIANMPGIIDDLIASIEESGRKSESPEKISADIGAAVSSLLGKNLADLEKDFPQLREKLFSVMEKLHSFLQDGKFREKAGNIAAGAFRSFSSKSLLEISESCFGLDSTKASDFIARKAKAFLHDPGSSGKLAHAITGFISGYVDTNSDKSLGEALGVTAETKTTIDRLLASKSLELLNLKIQDILLTIGVRELVIERIDSLDVEDVEKIVLDFMKEEFTWINFFGLILGALIGLVQAAIAFIT